MLRRLTKSTCNIFDINYLIKIFLEEFEKIGVLFTEGEFEKILKEWRKHSYTIDYYLLVPGYLPDIAHAFQVLLYGFRGNAVLERKLGLGLLALYVIGEHLRIIAATAGHF